MKLKELRELESDTLSKKVLELETSLFNSNFKKKLGSLENPSSIRLAKREIAQIKTILTERLNGRGNK